MKKEKIPEIILADLKEVSDNLKLYKETNDVKKLKTEVIVAGFKFFFLAEGNPKLQNRIKEIEFRIERYENNIILEQQVKERVINFDAKKNYWNYLIEMSDLFVKLLEDCYNNQ